MVRACAFVTTIAVPRWTFGSAMKLNNSWTEMDPSVIQAITADARYNGPRPRIFPGNSALWHRADSARASTQLATMRDMHSSVPALHALSNHTNELGHRVAETARSSIRHSKLMGELRTRAHPPQLARVSLGWPHLSPPGIRSRGPPRVVVVVTCMSNHRVLVQSLTECLSPYSSPTSRFNMSSIRICLSSMPSSRSLQLCSSSARPVVPRSDCLASTSDALPIVPPLMLVPLVLGSLRGNGTPPGRVLPGAGDPGREGVGVKLGDANANFLMIPSSFGGRALRVLPRGRSSMTGEGGVGR